MLVFAVGHNWKKNGTAPNVVCDDHVPVGVETKFAKLKTWAAYACSFTLACMIAFRDLTSKTTKDINTIFMVHKI